MGNGALQSPAMRNRGIPCPLANKILRRPEGLLRMTIGHVYILAGPQRSTGETPVPTQNLHTYAGEIHLHGPGARATQSNAFV